MRQRKLGQVVIMCGNINENVNIACNIYMDERNDGETKSSDDNTDIEKIHSKRSPGAAT